jgi:ABC-type dipeptide/oligopeptide/nickel transport system ATPase component
MRRQLSLIFISHDLNVVWYLSDYIVVLLEGVIVEKAPKTEIFENPLHPYTKDLLSTETVLTFQNIISS